MRTEIKESTKVTVLGGGTAGVVSACFLAQKPEKFEVEWIRDPNISPVSVGEGSTLPMVINTFASVGADPSAIYDKIGGSKKFGIRKFDWNKDEYMHYFGTTSYAIHFAAHEFQNWIWDTINDPKITKIEKHIVNPKEEIDSNYVIDCRGGTGEGEEFEIIDTIPTNKAYVEQVYHTDGKPLFEETLCIARPYGWVFIIPLMNRYSIGYIYNKNFATDDQIKNDIKEVYKYVPYKPEKEGNFIPFNNYKRKQNFEWNYSYNGAASFFYEPLEATSHEISNKIAGWSFDTLRRPAATEIWQTYYDRELLQTEAIINLHYLAKTKWDTDFWKYANESAEKTFSHIYSSKWSKIFKHISEGIYDTIKKQGHYGRSEMIQSFGQWPGQSWVQNIDGLGVMNKLKEIDEKANRS